MKVGIADAKRRLTELLERAEAGEEVVITRYGSPIVKLELVNETAERERTIEFRKNGAIPGCATVL